MRILMTEAEAGDGRTVGALLATEGHDVSFCHPAGSATAVCAGMSRGGRCPLLAEEIDVVVDVRIGGGPVTAREMGALCAVHHGAPLLVAGSVPADLPLAGLVRFSCEPASVLSACAGLETGGLEA